MKIAYVVCILGLLALACGCTEDKAVVKGRLRDAWSQISDRDFLRTRGIGVAPAEARGQTQRRGLSRQAARDAGWPERIG